MTIGYRHWDVRNGKLYAPFTGIPLPPNGITHNVSFYATKADLDKATWFLQTPVSAWTTGTVTGTTTPDTRQQVYTVHGREFTLPDCLIGEHYQVNEIFTDYPIPLVYDGIPIRRWTP